MSNVTAFNYNSQTSREEIVCYSQMKKKPMLAARTHVPCLARNEQSGCGHKQVDDRLHRGHTGKQTTDMGTRG